QVWRRLWTEEHVTHEGKHFHLEDVTLLPRPAQPQGPRLLFSAGNGGQLTPRQARRVVELGDGMFPSRATPAEYRQAWEGVLAEARARGRDPATLVPGLYWTIHLDTDADRAERECGEWLTGYYGVLRNFGQSVGDARRIREQLDAYLDAGVRL